MEETNMIDYSSKLQTCLSEQDIVSMQESTGIPNGEIAFADTIQNMTDWLQFAAVEPEWLRFTPLMQETFIPTFRKPQSMQETFIPTFRKPQSVNNLNQQGGDFKKHLLEKMIKSTTTGEGTDGDGRDFDVEDRFSDLDDCEDASNACSVLRDDFPHRFLSIDSEFEDIPDIVDCPEDSNVVIERLVDRDIPDNVVVNTDGAKMQCCLYCKKVVSKIARHYLKVHKDEADVQDILSLSTKNPLRKTKFEKLRLEGNFHHNVQVLKQGSGLFLVVRRSKGEKGEAKRANHYVPCTKCLGFFCKGEIWKHHKFCKFGKSVPGHCNVIQLGYSFLDRHVNDNVRETSEVFTKMRRDRICLVAEEDFVIRKFCSFLERRSKGLKDVSCKIRELGRLVLKLKQMYGDARDLKSFLKPTEFERLLDAARSLSFSNGHKVKPITLGIRLGQNLKRICTLMKILAIKHNDDDFRADIESFEALLFENWMTQVKTPFKREIVECISYTDRGTSLEPRDEELAPEEDEKPDIDRNIYLNTNTELELGIDTSPDTCEDRTLNTNLEPESGIDTEPNTRNNPPITQEERE